jgi:uncharacterized protein YggE
MTTSDLLSISVKAQSSIEAKPDVALVKLHVAGEGVSIVDAVESVQQKTVELGEHLRNTYKQIRQIDIFDVYFGQKQERLGAESHAYPRPLVVRGLLVTAEPDDSAALHRIIDEAVKKGALLTNPQRNPAYVLGGLLDSALLFGLIASEEHERRAVEECLNRAAMHGRNLASAAGRELGGLTEIRDVTVEPSVGEPFHKEFSHIRRLFPTRFLSATPHKVLILASLIAKYDTVKR